MIRCVTRHEWTLYILLMWSELEPNKARTVYSTASLCHFHFLNISHVSLRGSLHTGTNYCNLVILSLSFNFASPQATVVPVVDVIALSLAAGFCSS
jgi:hypothetical protein